MGGSENLKEDCLVEQLNQSEELRVCQGSLPSTEGRDQWTCVASLWKNHQGTLGWLTIDGLSNISLADFGHI